MTKPRLCLVFPHVVLGGGETAMMEVAEGLRGEFVLEVCALDNVALTVERTIREELRARFGAVAFLRRRWELRPRFRGAQAVLWYGVVNAVPDVLARMERRPASVRVVHTEREVDGRGFQRRWGRVVDRTLCVCPAVARRLPGAAFVPNPGPRRHSLGPRQELLPPGRKTLGWMGRLVPLKNVAWLLDHLEALGCNLLIQALDTAQQRAAELEDQAVRRGLGERVFFLPPGRDVGTLLRSADALVIASEHEGLPMVAIEAGMLGVPVIATRVGALPELFPDEVLFVESEGGTPTVESMRRAVERVDASWGRRLQRKVTPLCDPGAVAERYAEAIHAACDARARAGG